MTLLGGVGLLQGGTAAAATPVQGQSATTLSAITGAAIVQTAEQYLGYPYSANGRTPETGFDDIGFVSFVYRSEGLTFPFMRKRAYRYAPHVAMSDLQPGDVVYFKNTVFRGLSHLGIYVGNGQFIHAEWYNRGVVITSFVQDPVDGSYWIGKYLGANRPLARAL